MIPSGCFVTGTDTGVGKTLVSAALLKIFNDMTISCIGLKPLASGCTRINNIFQNQDALLLQQYSSLQLPYEIINPFAFEAAIAPHLAARLEGINLSVQRILAGCNQALQAPVEYIVVEGAGGVMVPLNEKETMLDLMKAFRLPVILVVGMRLGCLNHALLSVNALQTQKVPVLAWVANIMVDDMDFAAENIQTLEDMLPMPLLGVIPYQRNISVAYAASCLMKIVGRTRFA